MSSNPLELLKHSTITAHTSGGNFTGELMGMTPDMQTAILKDGNTIHLVFNDELAGITIEHPSNELMALYITENVQD